MKIELRYFASLRETLGVSAESLELPAGVTTLAQLRALLQARGGIWQAALTGQRALRTACNHQMCNDDLILHEGCEIAFFPPVTGG
jgi:molybdopterin synthase sulfur carrier subunit